MSNQNANHKTESTKTATTDPKSGFKRKAQMTIAAATIVLLLAAFTPNEASAFGSSSYRGGSGTCTGCTIYNHNETLVEDVA